MLKYAGVYSCEGSVEFHYWVSLIFVYCTDLIQLCNLMNAMSPSNILLYYDLSMFSEKFYYSKKFYNYASNIEWNIVSEYNISLPL